MGSRRKDSKRNLETVLQSVGTKFRLVLILCVLFSGLFMMLLIYRGAKFYILDKNYSEAERIMDSVDNLNLYVDSYEGIDQEQATDLAEMAGDAIESVNSVKFCGSAIAKYALGNLCTASENLQESALSYIENVEKNAVSSAAEIDTWDYQSEIEDSFEEYKEAVQEYYDEFRLEY